MQTTAGSLALRSLTPKVDAPLVTRLRSAGAGHPRQNQPQRMGQHPLQRSSTSGWSARRRADAQSLRPLTHAERFQLRLRRGRRRGLCPCRPGHGDRRLHRQSPSTACGIVGLKPTVGLSQPQRHHPHRPQPGHRRPHDPHRQPMPRSCWERFVAPQLANRRAARPPANSAPTTRSIWRATDCAGARLGVARAFFGRNPRLNRVLDGCVGQLRAARRGNHRPRRSGRQRRHRGRGTGSTAV
jgi:hypothetical protein